MTIPAQSLTPPPEYAHLRYHFLIDTRVAASDGVPYGEPMLWNRKLWFRIGSPDPFMRSQHHHWRYHGPCIPTAIVPSSADEIERLRTLLREAGAATSFMPDDWKQRARELGV